MEPELHRPNAAAYVAGLCLVTLVGLLIFSIYQTQQAVTAAAKNAQAGLVAHHILCGQKAYYADQVALSTKFLKMSQKERADQYGAIGNIPDAVIASGLVKQQLLLGQYKVLDCTGEVPTIPTTP